MTEHVLHDTLPGADDDNARALIAALANPEVFDHPVRHIRLIETHISWVILTGDFAYKIKKPVSFGFLDFSTLPKRRFYCEEELRLNRRFAPDIYLELVEIRGSETSPRMHGDGEVIEYAIKMIEFPQRCLLSDFAARNELDSGIIDAIADRLSEIHAASARAQPDAGFGNAAQVAKWSDENLVHIAGAIPAQFLPNSYFSLKRWYRENPQLLAAVDARKRDGFVRECHGDLHLGNMAMIDGRVTFFDCIEFNPELRWIDTVSEAAFVAMDLHARGYPACCWRFLNRYFANTGDYAATELLRYYFVYRALVRAKVEALRVDQQSCDRDGHREYFAPAIDYIELAHQWAGSHRAGLIVMHGLSGSGKSTVAARLVEALGAIQIRSDVERKRLFYYAATDDSGSGLNQGIYSAEATQATYRRLADLAAKIIEAEFTVIVDATLLHESQRRRFLEIESSHSFGRVIVDCEAPEAELRKRIVERENDPSEANLDVLEKQLQTREPIGASEREIAAVVTVGRNGIGASEIEKIRNSLLS
ncbi:MAG: AAA family ATPase [Gammaproteobacteria bacterium]|nr:AAA family ATPase [Gammaproteobacteria bacterium]